MTDIYADTARSEVEAGRTTRMTEEAARQAERQKYLAHLLQETLTKAENAEAFAQKMRDHAVYLRAVIDRERLDPTPLQAPPTDPAPAPSTAAARYPSTADADAAPARTARPPLDGPGPWPPSDSSVLSGAHAAVPPVPSPSSVRDHEAPGGAEENGGSSWPQ